VRRAALLALLLAACGGNPAPPPPPEDETLSRLARSGRLALELERPVEAARLYAQALDRARERDDAAAIADAGIGLAAAELARGRPRVALITARAVDAELSRRGTAVPPALSLAEAVARHRLGERAAALDAARQVEAGDDDAATRRAAFLRGLIAAEAGDGAALADARARLGAPEDPGFRADARELDARAALLAGDPAGARRIAASAAEDRRTSLDYRGLSRVLALEGEAARRTGATAAAADLYLRAGRGAAARGEGTEARRWLAEAERLARSARATGVAEAARAAQRALAARAEEG